MGINPLLSLLPPPSRPPLLQRKATVQSYSVSSRQPAGARRGDAAPSCYHLLAPRPSSSHKEVEEQVTRLQPELSHTLGPGGLSSEGFRPCPSLSGGGWKEVLLTPSALTSRIACGNETVAGMWLEGRSRWLRADPETSGWA